MWWGGAICCALLTWFVEVMTLRGQARPVPFTVYLALLAAVIVLGGVAFFTARNVLRAN